MADRVPYQHYFVMVPEQFTMKTQRRLVDCSANHVIMNVDVVSFERLAYRIFDELGIHQTVMEETGKSLVLRRIVEEKEDSLTILKGNLTKMGYIGELKSVISELMQYGISPEDLEDFLCNLQDDSALSMKLQDILQVYRAFDDYLGEDYVTAEKVLEVLENVADESALLKGAVLVFDGYTGFTPVQMNLLRRLMGLVSDIYVTVTLDLREPVYRAGMRAADSTFRGKAQIQELFYMSHKMVHALTDAAREAAFEIAEPIRIEAREHSRFAKNPVLAYLEQNLFRARCLAYEAGCGDHLRLCSLASPRAELDFTAATIGMLVREKGYHYGDFAIVSGNVDCYDRYADSVFSRYDIPYFADKKQSVLYHPLIELIRAAMEMARTDYSYESVFRFLRTGLCGFSSDETDLLENYCIEKGIRGVAKWRKRFIKPFHRHGRVPEDSEYEQSVLEQLNHLRERFWKLTGDIIGELRKKDASVRERTETLYALLCQTETEEQLRKQKEMFEESGQEILAAEYRQIYKIVIDLFDKMADLLGEDRLTLEDYTDVLEAGFASAKVGAIPQGSDCVILGDIERTRLDGIKVLFFMGVNDGVIPKKPSRQSILSQYDRERMESNRMELAPGEREQVFLQRFYLYLNLTKPSDALYLTYARMDGNGKAVRPSYLISVLQKMFPQLAAEEIAADAAMPLMTAKSGVEVYLRGLTLTGDTDQSEQNMEEWKALHRWYMENGEYAPRIQRMFEAHFQAYTGESLEADLARLLYGTVLVNSVTRLELYARCAFAHFLEYGLKLADRREFTFESLDMGTMFHSILQKYCTRLEKTSGWDQVTETQQDELLREAMEEAVLEMPNESLLESSRSAYVLERIYRIMKRSIWAMTEQIRRGDFRPEGYEVEFSSVSRLTPETLMRTVGSVDRLDLYENENKIYVKVVDYKSGNTKFQLLSLYYGMQLQLVLYLNAAMEKVKKEHPDKEVIPAGIFYYHLDDPMVDADGADEEEIAKRILNSLRPNGLVNLEPVVYLHMDRDLLKNKKSDVIPVALKNDRTLSKTGTSAASTEDFGHLADHVSRCIADEGRQMLEGDISAKPYRLADRTGCDYCTFRGVCGFDRKVSGYEYKQEKYLKDEEIWERLRAKDDGEARKVGQK
ncbi:MAG: PD-(D/E)XK nuclease family protein [Clostridiales bacterium]|nr:PD-(D/E)XK nuclease family protein [Clostridiales bacterium]